LENLHNSAYTAGVDFQHNWKERTWYLAGNAEISKVSGKPAALIATQRSSARYYQRPDSKYLSVDSSLTSLSGAGGTLKLGKSSQKKLQFETSITLRSPGLEFNDIGYMRYSDVIHHGTWVGYYLRNPFLIFNNFYLNTNYWMYWDFSGKLLSANTNVNFNSQFKNRWRINGNFNRQGENISTRLLRGGDSFINPGNQSFNFNIGSDRSKKLSFYFGNYQGFGDRHSFRGRSYWFGIDYNPLNSLALSCEPELSIENYELQYVSKEGNDANPVYLFARLDQKTMNLTFRLNYTINPELSLEYYGQPFISSGKYTNYKKITEPAADVYSERYRNFSSYEIALDVASNTYRIDNDNDGSYDYFVSNPDFNFRQFRSNMVIRWEYLPGSTLYIVLHHKYEDNLPVQK